MEVFINYEQSEGIGMVCGFLSWPEWLLAGGNGCWPGSSQPLLSGWWDGDLEGRAASKLGCRSTRLPTVAKTGFCLSQLFLTPGNWEGGYWEGRVGRQVFSHKSHPWRPNLEGGG